MLYVSSNFGIILIVCDDFDIDFVDVSPMDDNEPRVFLYSGNCA